MPPSVRAKTILIGNKNISENINRDSDHFIDIHTKQLNLGVMLRIVGM
jgi:hypothetical protein